MEKEELEAIYDSFMKCVQKVEGAETDKARAKWLKAAKEDYEDLHKHRTEYSKVQLRRVKRAMDFLEELEEEKEAE